MFTQLSPQATIHLEQHIRVSDGDNRNSDRHQRKRPKLNDAIAIHNGLVGRIGQFFHMNGNN